MAVDNYNAGMNAYDAGRYEEAKEWFEKIIFGPLLSRFASIIIMPSFALITVASSSFASS